jgi:HSP20 family protein
MRFDLPGVSKDQIKIDLHENTLTVSGERKTERKEGDAESKKHVSEVYYGSFMRSFTFPQTVDPERVEARSASSRGRV